MKIVIREEGKDKGLTIRVPLSLAMNPVTAAAVAGKTELSYKKAHALMKAFKQSAKLLDGKPFVEVIEKDGDSVTIFL